MTPGSIRYLLAVCAVPLVVQGQEPASLGKRDSWRIPLADLSVSFNELDGSFEKIRVTFGEAPDQAQITNFGDVLVKISKEGRERHVYPETPDLAHVVSSFEADIAEKVCNTFTATLKAFEKDLQKENWARLLYLDAYFPRFLKGFFYFYCSVRNSPVALPKIALVPDSLYESSLS